MTMTSAPPACFASDNDAHAAANALTYAASSIVTNVQIRHDGPQRFVVVYHAIDIDSDCLAQAFLHGYHAALIHARRT
jgi:hypothetical protein